MRKLRIAYLRKEKAERLLSNLEKARKKETITEDQYKALKDEYGKVCEDAVSEVDKIKSKIKVEFEDLQRHLEVLRQDLGNSEARFKVGEFSAEDYKKIERRTRPKIEHLEERILKLQSFINSKSSDEVGGYLEIKIKKQGKRRIVLPTFSNIFKFGVRKKR